ncbi:MAG: hypothetical protein KF709_02690 [Gemmatimonadaceae bacterium]|nr:hypothetical protein [Gemmatimonadaceae bacterium]
MQLDIRTNVQELIKDFGTMQQKQLPYAVKWMLRALEKDIAQATENRIQQKFSASAQGLRWLQRHVKILNPGSRLGRATLGQGRTGHEHGFVAIIPPGGAKLAGWDRYRGSLVAMMEQGGPTPGPKRFGGRASGPLSDLGRFPVPVRRPGTPSPFPRRLYPINLGLSARTGISTRVVGGGLKGKHRTFLVPITNSPGHSMVLQRFGRAKDDTMPLFWVQRDTRLPARHFFFPTADLVVRTRLVLHFERAMQQALFGRGAYKA